MDIFKDFVRFAKLVITYIVTNVIDVKQKIVLFVQIATIVSNVELAIIWTHKVKNVRYVLMDV